MPTLSRILPLLAVLLAAAPVAAAEIRFAALARPGTAQYTVAQTFKELVEARSGGRYTVVIDPPGTRPRESEVIEQLRGGALHMGVITASGLENLLPTTRVLSFPFLFTSGDEADRALDGPAGAALLRDVEAIGLKGLGYTEGGFRHLTNSIRPVRTADDVRGLKIRVTGSPVQTAFWSALGAKPTPGPWPIYADLEAGVLEGQDNPLRIVEAYGFDEVQPYLSLTRHAYIAYLNLAALSWWSTLSPADQQLLQSALTEASRFQRQDQRARDAARVPVLMGRGMRVEEAPDLESFRARTAGLRDQLYFSDPRVRDLLARMEAAARTPAPVPTAEPSAAPTPEAGALGPAPEATGPLPATGPTVADPAVLPPVDQPALDFHDMAAPLPVEPTVEPSTVEPPSPPVPPDASTAPATVPDARLDPAPGPPPVARPDQPAAAEPPPAPAASQVPAQIVHPGRDSEGQDAPIIEERIPAAPGPSTNAAAPPVTEPPPTDTPLNPPAPAPGPNAAGSVLPKASSPSAQP